MSEASKPEVGTVGWIDLTVENAPEVRDFYREVVGWKVAELEMDGYSDYCMNTPDSETTTAGVCHKRGPNAELPAHWMIYITVADLEQSMARCREHGGEVLGAVRSAGPSGRFCVIRDPGGAVAGLFQHTS